MTSTVPVTIQSSGDLIADRRYAYAEALAEAGDFAAAADVLEQTMTLAPGWAAGWRALGRARLAMGDVAGAAVALRTALAADPDDALGAGLELSRIDAGTALDAAPAAYVAALFDAYAPTFDRALVERLGYRAPDLIAEALADLGVGKGRGAGRVLDLGCGTGLMAEALRARAKITPGWIEGVDLSGGMLAEARGKGLYDALHEDDLHAALLRQSVEGAAPIDLLLAADVLIYTGDLGPIMASAAARLAPGGRFAFTLEAMTREAAPDWRLRETLRFAHSGPYVRGVLAAVGLETDRFETVTLRLDRGKPVAGWLVIARRPASLLVDDAFLHHEVDGLQRRDVGERIAVDGDEIG